MGNLFSKEPKARKSKSRKPERVTANDNSNNHHHPQAPISQTNQQFVGPPHTQNVVPPPPPNSHNPPRVLARALYTYEGQNIDDLRFEKGDYMFVLSNMGEPWWLAEHTRTREKGYVPSNYVVIDDGLPTSLDAWFDIPRRECEKLLLRMGNPSGTYIIRPSSDSRHFALSVRHHVNNNFWVVKHYKIRAMDNGAGYYVTNRATFSHIVDLIKHYSENMDGLCCLLTIACPRTIRPPVQFRELEVNRESINMVSKLGTGSFGEVWLAKWNGSVEVAVKTLKANTMEREKFIEEAQLMHRLHHPRIVQILGICTEPASSPVYIITELMCNGSLLEFLRRDEGKRLRPDDMFDMLAQICEGMAYLESMNFVHRDLRAANILVGENNSVKVADFGLARITNQDDIYNGDRATKFPIKWTAPEAAIHRCFSVKSDVWSFGILIYEMVTFGRTPYPGMNNSQVIDEVSRGYRLPNPNGGNVQCSDDLYNIMLKCWDSRPENRYTFRHLAEVFENWTINLEQQYVDQQG